MEIELADAVRALRDELVSAAAQAGPEQEIGFRVGPIELEFTVELRVDASVKTGFKAWVLSADASGGVARGRTQKVKVTVTPTSRDGKDLVIAGNPDRPAGSGVDEPDALER